MAAYTSLPGVRHVTDAVKRQVYAPYGVKHSGAPPTPPSPRASSRQACCEVDHLISLELGGSNAIENLWPEPYPDATAKDKLENGLHWLVCHGRLRLRVAQRGIAADWVKFTDSLVKAKNWVGVEAENAR